MRSYNMYTLDLGFEDVAAVVELPVQKVKNYIDTGRDCTPAEKKVLDDWCQKCEAKWNNKLVVRKTAKKRTKWNGYGCARRLLFFFFHEWSVQIGKPTNMNWGKLWHLRAASGEPWIASSAGFSRNGWGR